MARVVGIDHLVIRVKDFERSKAFYDIVLGCLGFKRKYTFGKTSGWSNGKTLFWIGEADAEGRRHPHRIGNIGFHHYAFELGSGPTSTSSTGPGEARLNVVDPPADYPDYGEGYYAVFFLDPDGLKLEGMVFKPPRKKKRAKARKNTDQRSKKIGEEAVAGRPRWGDHRRWRATQSAVKRSGRACAGIGAALVGISGRHPGRYHDRPWRGHHDPGTAAAPPRAPAPGLIRSGRGVAGRQEGAEASTQQRH